MSRAGRKTKRRKRSVQPTSAQASVAELFRLRLTNPDPRSHAEFIRDMRAKQAAGKLVDPATQALLDRLERAIHQ